MKTIAIRLICLLAAVAPIAASAQTHIKSAFDAIINCQGAEISEHHYSGKDPKTKLKTGQDDIYNFVIPANKKNLIKNVLEAFENDETMAYVVKRGKNIEDSSQIELYSGEGGNASIPIDEPYYNYIYSLFATSKSEDPKGAHRYAYGFNYKEEDGVIKGKIIINYATTSEYRQEAERQRQIDWLREMDKVNKNVSDSDSQQSWFEMVMACLNGLKDANTKTRIALATKAYKLVGNMEDYEVSDQDKNTIRKMFEITLANPAYSDPILYELLKQCKAGIK